ncbi:hypothetical protein Ptr902_10894 [Pyrenophora tritici-repentis]|uniref:Uncharacterized protein n=1 Tax=Pyrenophora tritici-repentis TaxID=45151 RepID=A0A5M9KWA2_9PLEO|nr:hypothetical protein PtrV1_11876 [Pyrenophora tritici-repentis]KAF7444667.1 hypothetical protein A1F99_112200 [Pyrenophora tritici-repentis]KAF7564671.1 hypothetical protein PtrM4_041050 [Pyrenophora tritici-repentis]KAI0580351.1 hypothetical protein Alg215_05281 [Pyrenophora tritici-repentis]KAI0580457.1 hypothetical protein Alg130_07057 [Pyrenophora tritici-repentis]
MHLQSLIVLLAAVGACHAAPAEKCSQGTQSTGPCLFPEVLRECSSYAPVGVCHGYTKAKYYSHTPDAPMACSTDSDCVQTWQCCSY